MPTVLIADDDKSLAATIRLILTKKGFQVAQVDHGGKVLELLGVDPPKSVDAMPDVLVLDLTMPVKDGFAVAAALEDQPRTRSIPIIFLTGKGQLLELSEMPVNVKAYVQKPFEPEELLALLRDVIGGKVAR